MSKPATTETTAIYFQPVTTALKGGGNIPSLAQWADVGLSNGFVVVGIAGVGKNILALAVSADMGAEVGEPVPEDELEETGPIMPEVTPENLEEILAKSKEGEEEKGGEKDG